MFDRPAIIPTYSDPISPSESFEGSTNTSAMPSHQLIFSPQYIQLSSYLPTLRPSNSNSTTNITDSQLSRSTIYGLGEYYAGNYARNTSGTIQPFWALDIGDPIDANMYGHHAVYMDVRSPSHSIASNGTGTIPDTHAVWLRNPSGMDIILRDGVVQYRAIGGTLDFYFYSGDANASPSSSFSTSLSERTAGTKSGALSPRAVKNCDKSNTKTRTNSAIHVIEQYVQSIGLPQVPPNWAFGYHQCRWGYAVSCRFIVPCHLSCKI